MPFTVPVGVLPDGTYDWWIKGPSWLANSGTVALTGAPTTTLDMGLLRADERDAFLEVWPEVESNEDSMLIAPLMMEVVARKRER